MCTRTLASTPTTSNKHTFAYARSHQHTWHPTKMAWHARMKSLALSCLAGCRHHECITWPVDVKHAKPARRGSWAHVPAAFASSKLGPQILPLDHKLRPQARADEPPPWTSSSGRRTAHFLSNDACTAHMFKFDSKRAHLWWSAFATCRHDSSTYK